MKICNSQFEDNKYKWYDKRIFKFKSRLREMFVYIMYVVCFFSLNKIWMENYKIKIINVNKVGNKDVSV